MPESWAGSILGHQTLVVIFLFTGFGHFRYVPWSSLTLCKASLDPNSIPKLDSKSTPSGKHGIIADGVSTQCQRSE